MKNPASHLLSTACLALLLTGVACASSSSSKLPQTSPDPTPPSQSEARTQKGADLSVSKLGIEDLGPIYFDTDQALLRAEARAELKKHAQAIQDHPDWGVVTIEGHCDERGSEEYNLGLGKRRAQAVVQYLVDLGVPASRLETRSFGEEKPAVAGHTERAWSKNRRSEISSSSFDSAHR